MPTTVLLIRHGATDAIGRTLVGRNPGVHLNEHGQRQAAALGERLARVPLQAIYSSPLERTMATAEAIARPHGLTVQRADDLLEVDFGEWAGRTFDALQRDAGWRAWNTVRSAVRPPGGETILEVQTRAVRGIATLVERHPGAAIAAVSHGDVIRAAIGYYLGIAPDIALRLELSPASITIVRFGDGAPLVRGVNNLPDLLV